MAENIIEDERLDLRLDFDSSCPSCISIEPSNALNLLMLRNDIQNNPVDNSWEVTTMLADIEESAAHGCPTCFIILESLMRLSDNAVKPGEQNVELSIVFCEGAALRVYIRRKEDFLPGLAGSKTYSESLRLILEIYSLDGKHQNCFMYYSRRQKKPLISSICFEKIPH